MGAAQADFAASVVITWMRVYCYGHVAHDVSWYMKRDHFFVLNTIVCHFSDFTIPRPQEPELVYSCQGEA